MLVDIGVSPTVEVDAKSVKRLAELSRSNFVVWGRYTKSGERFRLEANLQNVKLAKNLSFYSEASNEADILNAVGQLSSRIRENFSLSRADIREIETGTLGPSSESLMALRFYYEGVRFLREGQGLKSIQPLEDAIKYDSAFARAYSALSETYLRLGQDSQAEAFSSKAIESSEKLGIPERTLIAAAHSRVLRDYPNAIEKYESLASQYPGSVDVNFDLADSYEGAGSFEKARDRYSRILTLDPTDMNAVLAVGRTLIESDKAQNGLEFLDRGLIQAKRLGNEEMTADILQAMGVAYDELNRPPDALHSYELSMEINRRLENKFGIAANLNGMAQIESAMGKSDRAVKDYARALQLRREIGDKAGIGDILNDLGSLYIDHGQFDKALQQYRESLRIQVEIGNEQNQALALSNIGNTYLGQGDYENARIYFEQSLRLSEKLEIPAEIADTLHNLAETSADLGHYGDALEQYLRALELRRSLGDKRSAAIESFGMGTVFGFQGRFGAALSSEQGALDAFRESGETGFWLAEALNGYGNALASVGRTADAKQALNDALTIARELQNHVLMAEILGGQGDNFFYTGDFNSARSLYTQALRAASRTSDHHLILAGKLRVAKVAVKQRQAPETFGSLQRLAEETNAAGMKYLAVECSMYFGESLIDDKKYQRAHEELSRASHQAEKLGLRALLVQIDYLLSRASELLGDRPESERENDQATRILAEIRQESS